MLRATEIWILEKMRDVLIVSLVASFICFAVYVAVLNAALEGMRSKQTK